MSTEITNLKHTQKKGKNPRGEKPGRDGVGVDMVPESVSNELNNNLCLCGGLGKGFTFHTTYGSKHRVFLN